MGAGRVVSPYYLGREQRVILPKGCSASRRALISGALALGGTTVLGGAGRSAGEASRVVEMGLVARTTILEVAGTPGRAADL